MLQRRAHDDDARTMPIDELNVFLHVVVIITTSECTDATRLGLEQLRKVTGSTAFHMRGGFRQKAHLLK